MAKYDSYIICTSPRSGSTLLCKLLKKTAVAGNPDSYFHQPSVSTWCEDRGIDQRLSMPECGVLDLIFHAAVREGSLETGIFGLRLQRHSFDFFAQKLAVLHVGFSSDAQRFRAAFGRTLFIHLTRQNKIEQAISYVKAEQTGLWHMAPDGTELERLAPPSQPTYDADQIQRHYDRFTTYDRDWKSWFDAEDIEPLRISYETLSADPVDTLRHVLDHLGLDRGAAQGVTPEVAKLADNASRDWAARFRLEQDVSKALSKY